MNACKICGTPHQGGYVKTREMMYGMRDEFAYFECAGCGCVQISEVPGNLEKYYAAGYGAHVIRDFSDLHFQQPFLKRFLKEKLYLQQLGIKSVLGHWLWKRYGRAGLPPWIAQDFLKLRLDARVMEIGAGAGDKLISLRHCGFSNLQGIDPFISADIVYAEGLSIKKAQHQELSETYDLVMLHHSLEHMPDQNGIFQTLQRVVRPGGWLLVRIPVGGCFAWQKYQGDWVQLDPPRHLFLHTQGSLRTLAERAGFTMEKVVFDSKGFQFWGSEQYLRDIPLKDPRSPFQQSSQSLFTDAELAGFSKEAEQLNAKGLGDQACFYLKKT